MTMKRDGEIDMTTEVAPAHRTLEELVEALESAGPSPQDRGTVEMIVRRPDKNVREVLESADVDLAVGVVGDNWHARGSSSMPDKQANPEAQIAIMNSRTIHAIAQDRTFWPLAGDQLFLDLDLSAENLPAGQRLAIGSVILEVTALPHNGCAKFTERFGSGATHLVNSKEGRENRRRGINTRVIQAGTIRVGDTVTKIDAE
jgi:hypothetical protein